MFCNERPHGERGGGGGGEERAAVDPAEGANEAALNGEANIPSMKNRARWAAAPIKAISC